MARRATCVKDTCHILAAAAQSGKWQCITTNIGITGRITRRIAIADMDDVVHSQAVRQSGKYIIDHQQFRAAIVDGILDFFFRPTRVDRYYCSRKPPSREE